MAGESREPGVIQATAGIPYPKPWIAQTLNIPVDLLDRTLAKLIQTERIEMNSDSIRILNFQYYQSHDRCLEGEDKKERSCPGDKSQDPEKYVKGKYGHMVRRK